MDSDTHTIVTTIRISCELDKKIDALNKHEKRSKSALLRLLIEEAIEAREGKFGLPT